MAYLKAGQSALGTQILSQAVKQNPKLPETEKEWLP
jgi:hypothetical protein